MTSQTFERAGCAVAKTLRGGLFISSFTIPAWILFCLTCLTEDWFIYYSSLLAMTYIQLQDSNFEEGIGYV